MKRPRVRMQVGAPRSIAGVIASGALGATAGCIATDVLFGQLGTLSS
ncbi:MAG: hypothetical protein ACRBN8_45705 [Nannocystales bacterium]